VIDHDTSAGVRSSTIRKGIEVDVKGNKEPQYSPELQETRVSTSEWVGMVDCYGS
jgi:hypothetical protein